MLVFRFSRRSGAFEISGTSAGTERARGIFRPPVDIYYNDRIFTVRMDLPGVNVDALTIEAGDNSITIHGSTPVKGSTGPCRLMERPSGNFLRTLNFPGRISPDKITAELENGVLTMRVPAPELDRNPTTIEIRMSGAD
jgi:HSP20 family protein